MQDATTEVNRSLGSTPATWGTKGQEIGGGGNNDYGLITLKA